MIQTNWYVITGGPSSGKTTLINHLAELGYKTAPEIARFYINQLLSHEKKTLQEVKHDIHWLQRKILNIMLRRERNLPKDDLIFFDRGTPDSIGYFRFHHLDEAHVVRACQYLRYKKIFFCHPLPVIPDSIRDEDDLTAKKISDCIYDAYADLNYPVIELPATSIKERLEIILSHIDV
ncbi:TPA: ATP-binding protein [Legionella pneumophila]|nr:AAA family ATPase [Legionella pneumophila]HAU1319354.1 ATP-binding protein [Legionella pneumophila]HBC0467377.1 ATP-binding protein [Legionella pneumophila]HBD9373347.1 ATP-binding protein [Legionella pneumophila]HBI2944975.1 ATP-binding protein [Legionella pneumophila]